MLIVRKLLLVTCLGFAGNLIQLFDHEYRLERKELKRLAFSLKSVIKLFFILIFVA